MKEKTTNSLKMVFLFLNKSAKQRQKEKETDHPDALSPNKSIEIDLMNPYSGVGITQNGDLSTVTHMTKQDIGHLIHELSKLLDES